MTPEAMAACVIDDLLVFRALDLAAAARDGLKHPNLQPHDKAFLNAQIARAEAIAARLRETAEQRRKESQA